MTSERQLRKRAMKVIKSGAYGDHKDIIRKGGYDKVLYQEMIKQGASNKQASHSAYGTPRSKEAENIKQLAESKAQERDYEQSIEKRIAVQQKRPTLTFYADSNAMEVNQALKSGYNVQLYDVTKEEMEKQVSNKKRLTTEMATRPLDTFKEKMEEDKVRRLINPLEGKEKGVMGFLAVTSTAGGKAVGKGVELMKEPTQKVWEGESETMGGEGYSPFDLAFSKVTGKEEAKLPNLFTAEREYFPLYNP